MFKINRNMWAGIILTFTVAIVAEQLGRFLPMLGSETMAMFLGLIVGNLVLTGERWNSGVKWSEKYPIEVGIAVLGFSLTFKTIFSLGWQGIIFTLLLMWATIKFVMWLGVKVFNVDIRTAAMMAGGNAVCGSSAIASIAPAIKAHDDDRRTAVAVVSISGTILLLVLPMIAPMFLGDNDVLMGALVGGTVQSVGQVVGTASLINPEVVTYATLFKMLRVILLSVVVIYMARAVNKNSAEGESVATQSKIGVPWFVIVFFIGVMINTFLHLPENAIHVSKSITGFFGVVNLAGIGLNLKWLTIKKAGTKFLGYGLLTIIFQIAMALALIYLIY
ncbi:hypothetical protein WS105_0702 [Weissella ceti]|uniref:Sulfate exporter family transporter n=3 Tax=Lactobacillaceae TaxID=33958 RepID=A0A075TVJ1_9LACO|nr:hypothetical protein WS08_0640 [Weissella tructae]AIM62894.1 hypothetical protein WS74_0642 [Weissella ceti]AIM64292.1 hypothetical protein WS105_0702 [Weissella ceti]ELA06964.1 hypothetical protein WCNC_05272 [Weissella ceti NC36]